MKKFLVFLKMVLFALLAIVVANVEMNLLTFFAGLMNQASDLLFLTGLLGIAGSFALSLYVISLLGHNIFKKTQF